MLETIVGKWHIYPIQKKDWLILLLLLLLWCLWICGTMSNPRKKKEKSGDAVIPMQLANLIRDEAGETSANLNQVVSACQNRHVKELSSYVKSVCMRMGLAAHPG